jgi:Tfp pilus assembly protein PilV
MGEILIAMLFLALSILAVLGVQIYATKNQVKASHRFRASQKAEAVMTDIEDALSADLDLDVGVARIALPATYNPEGQPAFEYDVTQSFIGPDTDRLKEVTVTVYWTDAQGQQSYRCGSRFTE